MQFQKQQTARKNDLLFCSVLKHLPQKTVSLLKFACKEPYENIGLKTLCSQMRARGPMHSRNPQLPAIEGQIKVIGQ